MRFRPCIDLHEGRVKQIVGATLSDSGEGLQENFVSERPPAWFARLYREDGLTGGHVIMLGPGNEAAAAEALAAWPGGMQVGGGITADNARAWLDRGAAAVIVTSYVFREGRIERERLARLTAAVGRERLVLDLSCRRRGKDYYIVTDRWQRFTEVRVEPETLEELSRHCAEFLVHAADVEGRCAGVAEDLAAMLGSHSPIPVTYAGGIGSMADIDLIEEAGRGRVDFTVGSALDIFGGRLAYREVVERSRSDGRD